MPSVLDDLMTILGDLVDQPDRTPEGFLQWMKDENQFIVHIELITDTRWVMIERLLLHYTIKTGTVNDYITGYEDRWCIATGVLAAVAFSEWKSRGFEGEPGYWHRHPNTGRRREDGDPEKETINF